MTLVLAFSCISRTYHGPIGLPTLLLVLPFCPSPPGSEFATFSCTLATSTSPCRLGTGSRSFRPCLIPLKVYPLPHSPLIDFEAFPGPIPAVALPSTAFSLFCPFLFGWAFRFGSQLALRLWVASLVLLFAPPSLAQLPFLPFQSGFFLSGRCLPALVAALRTPCSQYLHWQVSAWFSRRSYEAAASCCCPPVFFGLRSFCSGFVLMLSFQLRSAPIVDAPLRRLLFATSLCSFSELASPCTVVLPGLQGRTLRLLGGSPHLSPCNFPFFLSYSVLFTPCCLMLKFTFFAFRHANLAGDAGL